jgi:glutathione S-transferase
MLPIFHLALPGDWQAALRTGRYEISTRGRTLAEEGFVHCSFEHQVAGTAERFYADADGLILFRLDLGAIRSAALRRPTALSVPE